MIRTYEELMSLDTFEERFEYLKLQGEVGEATFGFERYLNQRFYSSWEWKRVRSNVIARDVGRDLALDGHDIRSRIVVHHMNPMNPDDLIHHNSDVLNPEYLITTQHDTHNAIHYGSFAMIKPVEYVERRPGDTMSWGKRPSRR